jgi:hypothetical protein
MDPPEQQQQPYLEIAPVNAVLTREPDDIIVVYYYCYYCYYCQ